MSGDNNFQIFVYYVRVELHITLLLKKCVRLNKP